MVVSPLEDKERGGGKADAQTAPGKVETELWAMKGAVAQLVVRRVDGAKGPGSIPGSTILYKNKPELLPRERERESLEEGGFDSCDRC